LAARGFDGKRPIAVLMDRGFPCLTALLAALKLGAAYVPIDLKLPARRVDYMLADSKAACILIDGSSRDAHGRVRDDVVPAIDVEDPAIAAEPAVDLDRTVSADSPAYCIYTSGSTGEPKGVVVHHRGLVNYIWWAKKQYVSDDIESFALYSSLSFDLTVTSIFVPLICGRTIRIYPEPRDEAPLIRRVVEDNETDVLKLTPAHLMLLRNMDLTNSRLKVLILGGEDLKAEHALDIHRMLGGRAAIYNEYGPTETVVGCMIYRFDPTRDTQGSVPIGVAIDNMSIHLLNENLQPVPDDTIGEIHIGGESVAIGYLGKPELTARSFIRSPLDPSARLYRSGDLGRFNSNGDLVFLGRRDSQIKLRGYRIEPGEIESALLRYPGVEECVVHTTKTALADARASLTRCVRCGIASDYPNTTFSAEGICNHCAAYDRYCSAVDDYFGDLDGLKAIIATMKAARHPRYDCLLAFSGGKDSTYMLCRMVELGARVLAFTLDNGYLSDEAKRNIDHVVTRIGVEHRYLSTEHMDEIFLDSLRRYSNVCNGCFKTIYTMAINLATEIGVDHIMVGLSKGQQFETRLTALFRSPIFDETSFDHDIVEARKLYHSVDDAVGRRLDMSCVRDAAVMERIRFVDFYRYCDISREDIFRYIESRVGWTRPTNTGRSTNCLINDVGIYVHGKERHYHSYALPYSWDVRLGHIEREESLRELESSLDVDMPRVKQILDKLGYALDARVIEAADAQLVGYYVASSAIPPDLLREHLRELLPDYMVPTAFVHLDQLPLTPNGKVNRMALPKADLQSRRIDAGETPRTAVEKWLAELWTEVLLVDNVGVDDNFFELGGHSLPALMLLYRIDTELGKTISIATFSQAPTIRALAQMIGEPAGAREQALEPL
jgi:amino acid adenylation domain-containing protein